ncbi:hypothetical protein WNY61_09215 [Sulfitobacter sp. AS92]|uniref:hypothetical protein n=1 Tax=Sulfitobacter sp. AS92 TaxID=3135783 RepID=UPI003174FD02
MADGVDFFETSVGAVTMRCDVLMGNVDLWVTATGELFACYAGIADVRAGLDHWSGPGRASERGPDLHALLDAAVVAINSSAECIDAV